MTGLATALTFYTRIPLRRTVSTPGELARAAPWFPVAGAAVGGVVAGAYWMLSSFLPASLAATLSVAAGAALTGAFHEDGLADVADAFAGGATIERRLEILDDPGLGTFGVIAVVAAFGARVASIASLDVTAALALVPAAHVLSRVPAVVLMRREPLAREDGLAAALADAMEPRRGTAAVIVGLVLSGLLIGVWTLPAAALTAAVAAGVAAVARRKIGGTNGDVLGATQQLAELTVLAMGVAVAHNAWGDFVWWTA